MQTGVRIDYKVLRTVNPETARLAVLEYLDSCGHHVAETACTFGLTRTTVYALERKRQAGSLADRSRAPHHRPRQTPAAVEDRVIARRNQTHLGPKRLSLYLAKYEGRELSWATIRHILRRNRQQLTPPFGRRRPSATRPFVDWYAAKPFEIVQIDLKYIRDHKALSRDQIAHLDRHGIPNFQWGALDVTSRFKLVAYSQERTWTNGLCFYLWTIAWLRSHGVAAKIAFTVDHGEEFGGQSWLKVQELRKLIAGFGCTLIQNHKGHPEENAHLERSHLTDDQEFYIPRAFQLTSPQRLLEEATGYLYYYNTLRAHSALDYRTPFQALQAHLPQLDPRIRLVVPILLDSVAVQLGPWSGYNVLAQHRVLVQVIRYTSSFCAGYRFKNCRGVR